MHALVLLCINQYTKIVKTCEVPSFTNDKDMIGGKILKNGSRDSDHAPFSLSQYTSI